MKRTALLALALAASTSFMKADAFAAKGAKATLTVEYVYRTVKLSVDLIAQTPQSLPTMHEMEAGQKADL